MNPYTIVMGASENPERYANKALKLLLLHNHSVIAIANKSGAIEGVEFVTKDLEEVLTKFKASSTDFVDTVTLYLGPKNQEVYYDFILKLKPRRIIFNPGTENIELLNLAEAQGIYCEEACTLVLLNLGQY